MINENNQEELFIAAAELTTVYKVVKHHQAFNSLDCIVKLNVSKPKIAAKWITVKNVLAPYFVRKLLC